MSTGIDGECHLVLPLCSLYHTNLPPNHWAALLKKKKGQSFTLCPWFFTEQITYMESCNLAEWSVCHILDLVLLVDRIAHWAVIRLLPLLDLMPSKFTEWIVNPLIGQSLIVIKIIKWFFFSINWKLLCDICLPREVSRHKHCQII